ncbi:hypothetical protein [Collimonas sp. PA-H2]|uniref:hypothetical protein n=1 Tax=Collimonas sp. PA-H2 TaxID=1881062 RepID=UPI001180120B|nr:hypothetical protein [Collimonas sp. PA-H2]
MAKYEIDLAVGGYGRRAGLFRRQLHQQQESAAMKRIGFYLLFAAIFLSVALVNPIGGHIGNAVSACISTIAMFFLAKQTRAVEILVLLLIFTVLLPTSIVIFIGYHDLQAGLISLVGNMTAGSLIALLLPTAAGVCTWILMKSIVSQLWQR